MRLFGGLLILLMATESFGQLPNTLTNADKVYGLSKFWQEVNYNFVYLNKVDRHVWDSTYIAMIDEVQHTTNDYDYYRLLKRFCATLKDGHTNIEFPEQVKSKLMRTMFGPYRLFIENIGHKAIITHINPSKKEEIPPGTEIVEVNGMMTNIYMDQFVIPYISSSTRHVLEDKATMDLLQGLEGDSFDLKMKKPDGGLIDLTVVHSRSAETEVYPAIANASALLEFKWIEGHLAYVALNSFEDPAIDSLFEAHLPELYQAEGLIIDLRNNGGGNGAYGLEILKYLIPGRQVTGAKSQSRNHIATYKAWGEMVSAQDTAGNPEYSKAYLNYTDAYYYDFPNAPQRINGKRKRLIVPTIVLIGHNTASAAEDFLVYSDKQPHFTTVGSPTFGSTGQPYYFILPGGGQARVCTKRDTYPDGREFVGFGILPDIMVEATLDDLLMGRDPVLAKAVSLLAGNSR